MTQRAHLSRISLEPAPGPHEKAAGCSYVFVAPLTPEGMLDAEAWKQDRGLCFVHRMEAGDIAGRGLLVHRPGGAKGATWVFDYELGDGDEETGFRFDSHAFADGAYVTVRDAGGEAHTYRVSSVKPA